MPVWDKSERSDGTFSRTEFAWNEQNPVYGCPGGKELRSNWRAFKVPRSGVTKADTIIYRASEHDCRGCSLKEQCCPNTPMRKIARSIHEHAREVAGKIATTPRYLRSRCERKKVEMLFAHLKRILRLDRLRLRGLQGAHDEFLMAAIAQNLWRMTKRLMLTEQETTKGLPAWRSRTLNPPIFFANGLTIVPWTKRPPRERRVFQQNRPRPVSRQLCQVTR